MTNEEALKILISEKNNLIENVLDMSVDYKRHSILLALDIAITAISLIDDEIEEKYHGK